jgi:hypothetical protein
VEANLSNLNLKVGQVVDRISGYLGNCSQKAISSLIAVSETALSQARARSLEEATEHKVGKRLMSLLYVVETLAKDETLNPTAIFKVLVTPCYPQEDGTYLDVASAIQLGTHPNERLTQIADITLKHFRSRYETEKWPLDDGLYNQAVGERISRSS